MAENTPKIYNQNKSPHNSLISLNSILAIHLLAR